MAPPGQAVVSPFMKRRLVFFLLVTGLLVLALGGGLSRACGLQSPAADGYRKPLKRTRRAWALAAPTTLPFSSNTRTA